MTELEQLITKYLSRTGYKPVRPEVLAKRLKLRKKDRGDFDAAIAQLVQSGRIHTGPAGVLRSPNAAGTVVGVLKRISSGAGFVIPHGQPAGDRSGDVFIAPDDMRDAHTGDEVLVRLSKRRRQGGQRTGQIEDVLVRATSTFVGSYQERGGRGYVQVDGGAFNAPVSVGDPGAKGARPDDVVVIEMLRFPTHFREGEAVLTKVLGARGEPGVDTLAIIHEYGLPDEFPDEVNEEARQQADEFSEDNLEGRLDLTNELIVTIDPIDARDFDDAISLDRSKDGHWHLGVHIADVAHFVQPGSELDFEAKKRGTSVYLPTRVLPMLPEVISNGLASLQQGRVRYTKSAFIEFTPEGAPIHTRFANSAIKVTRRFAYEEVMPILQDPERHKAKVSAKIIALLQRMHELAMILRRRRYDAGALEMNIPEVKIDFDKEGKVSGAHETVHDESHQIIEEFMLAANIAVATELSDRKIGFLRRTHGDPDMEKLRNFALFATALGYPLKHFQSRHELQELVKKVRGQPEEHAINYSLLRSMKQAEYSGIEMGHYALAVENYCHFTSPIRRYPDLTVHRLIDQIVSGRKRVVGMNEVELAKLGKACSNTERRAATAERELTKVKLLAFMADRIGEELDAIVTGVERFGIFVQGIEIPVDGLVHVSALDPNDYFYYDQAQFSMVGRNTGKQYRLGDRLRVSVAHVDVDRRVLDFRIVEPGRPGAGPQGEKRRPKKSSKPFEQSPRRGRRKETIEPKGRARRNGRKKRR